MLTASAIVLFVIAVLTIWNAGNLYPPKGVTPTPPVRNRSGLTFLAGILIMVIGFFVLPCGRC